MIGFLFGRIKSIQDAHVVILTGGVGFEVYCGAVAKSFSLGDEVELWIHTYVREDQLKLFGFSSLEERDLFLILNSISGVGPKTAFSIVEVLPPAVLANVIATNDLKALQSVQGIGRKTAERIMLELAGKLKPYELLGTEAASASGGADQKVWNDLREGLSGLGFPEMKVNRVINMLRRENQNLSLEELMEQALRKINS